MDAEDQIEERCESSMLRFQSGDQSATASIRNAGDICLDISTRIHGVLGPNCIIESDLLCIYNRTLTVFPIIDKAEKRPCNDFNGGRRDRG